jgi:hypothetical protein
MDTSRKTAAGNAILIYLSRPGDTQNKNRQPPLSDDWRFLVN